MSVTESLHTGDCLNRSDRGPARTREIKRNVKGSFLLCTKIQKITKTVNLIISTIIVLVSHIQIRELNFVRILRETN